MSSLVFPPQTSSSTPLFQALRAIVSLRVFFFTSDSIPWINEIYNQSFVILLIS